MGLTNPVDEFGKFGDVDEAMAFVVVLRDFALQCGQEPFLPKRRGT